MPHQSVVNRSSQKKTKKSNKNAHLVISSPHPMCCYFHWFSSINFGHIVWSADGADISHKYRIFTLSLYIVHITLDRIAPPFPLSRTKVHVPSNLKFDFSTNLRDDIMGDDFLHDKKFKHFLQATSAQIRQNFHWIFTRWKLHCNQFRYTLIFIFDSKSFLFISLKLM